MCWTAEEYTDAIMQIYGLGSDERQALLRRARSDVQHRFSGELFAQGIVRTVAALK